MNFDFRFKDIESDIERLSRDLKALKDTYENARDFTSIYLQCCEKHGISLTSIGKKTDLISACKGWPFGFKNNVFADEEENGCPAIWKVCEEMKLGGGGGNTGQHQASCARLVDGVYKLKNGTWLKIE